MSDIVGYPTPGKRYRVQNGDYLRKIAAIAYGDESRWPEIFAANQSTLRSPNPDSIFPGEILIIPGNIVTAVQQNEAQAVQISQGGAGKNDFSLMIDGKKINVTSARVVRAMDTACDGWTATVPWIPGKDRDMDRVLAPFSYLPAQVFLGSKLQVNGAIYGVESSLSIDGSVKNLEGWSKTVDIVDSMLKPPLEANNMTLEQRARALIGPLGLTVQFEATNPEAKAAFYRMTAGDTDTIFSHLSGYADQRGVLISNTPAGDVLFWNAKTTGSPVGTIEEGKPLATEWRVRFDGRARFSSYRSIGDGPFSNKLIAVANDAAVPKSRFMTFTCDDTTPGNVQAAANWRRSSQLAEALTIPFPVAGWYDPNGNLWEPNTLVTVISPTIHAPKGFTFLIRSVEFTYDPAGNSAVLNLIPPQVYSQQEIIEPWRAA
jgi:prophage tail gpP-like protein